MLDYHQVCDQIQDGDCLLFEPPRGINPQHLISWWTRSRFVHVGMATWVKVGATKRLFCLEAQLGVGVRLELVSDYILAGRRMHWYKLDDAAFPRPAGSPCLSSQTCRQKMLEFGVSQLGRNYIPEWQLVLNFLLLGRPKPQTMLAMRTQFSRPDWFCSELYSTNLQKGGIVLPGGVKPHKASPETVAEYPFLHDQGVLWLPTGN